MSKKPEDSKKPASTNLESNVANGGARPKKPNQQSAKASANGNGTSRKSGHSAKEAKPAVPSWETPMPAGYFYEESEDLKRAEEFARGMSRTHYIARSNMNRVKNPEASNAENRFVPFKMDEPWEGVPLKEVFTKYEDKVLDSIFNGDLFQEKLKRILTLYPNHKFDVESAKENIGLIFPGPVSDMIHYMMMTSIDQQVMNKDPFGLACKDAKPCNEHGEVSNLNFDQLILSFLVPDPEAVPKKGRSEAEQVADFEKKREAFLKRGSILMRSADTVHIDLSKKKVTPPDAPIAADAGSQTDESIVQDGATSRSPEKSLNASNGPDSLDASAQTIPECLAADPDADPYEKFNQVADLTELEALRQQNRFLMAAQDHDRKKIEALELEKEKLKALVKTHQQLASFFDRDSIRLQMCQFLDHDIKEREWFMNVVKDMMCVLCQKPLDDPVFVTCGHVFCRKCIIEEESFKCPICPDEPMVTMIGSARHADSMICKLYSIFQHYNLLPPGFGRRQFSSTPKKGPREASYYELFQSRRTQARLRLRAMSENTYYNASAAAQARAREDLSNSLPLLAALLTSKSPIKSSVSDPAIPPIQE